MQADPAPVYQGISSPMEVFGPFLRMVDMSRVISVFAAIIFFMWLAYTLVASYHLVRYGYRQAMTIPAIIVHVFVSISIGLFIVSGLH